MTREQLIRLTITEIINKQIKIEDIWQDLKKLHEENKDLNIFIGDTFNNQPKSNTIPMAIKDNYHIKGQITTCASKMMQHFVAPITATMVDRASKFASFVGKTNLDAYAIGSTGKNSDFGLTKSPWKCALTQEHMSPGGSSSGSAAAVALGVCLAAFGSETGGSVRMPAAWNGVVGFKPTYGLLSRYGIVELVSAYDVPGIFTKTVEDAKWVFDQLTGLDENDYTSIEYIPLKIKHKHFTTFTHTGETQKITDIIEKCANILQQHGFGYAPTEQPEILQYATQAYTIVNSVDVASNLSRFNGILYGNDQAKHTRTECFGQEIKRRTIVGNYIAYENNIHHHYTKAQQVMHEINYQINKIFEHNDFIILPVVPDKGFTITESLTPDPITMYQLDQYLCWSCEIGMPGITIPITIDEETKTPLAIQLIGPHMSDDILFQIGQILDNHFQFNQKHKWTNNQTGGKQ